MLDSVTEAISALQNEVADYSGPVQIWMRVMGVSFLSALVFSPWKSGARWIFVALVVNIAGLVIGKMIFPDTSRTVIGTGVHLLFWPGVLWAVWRPDARHSRQSAPASAIKRIYSIWLVWASLLLTISLVLDARTLIEFAF